jgi:ABC-2 type transport system permease protein
MKKLLLDIYYVWINELKVVFKDEAVILLFIIVPLAYPVLYSFIYNNETVHEVKVMVVDDSHSALSREFKRKVDATADVHIVGYAIDMEEAREAMRRKEAYGIMYIPADFSRKINTQQQTTVSVYADMSSLLFYKAMLLSATEVSLDMGADIRVAETGGETQEQDQTTRQTVESEWVTMYNPQNGFASFLVPAILILIIQQTLILGIATIVGTHNDKKRFTIASHTAEGKNVGAIKLTIGKAFCYASLYMLVSVWVLRVIPYIFKFPQIGDPLTIAVFLMPFLLAATFFGMTLSYFCSQREFGMILFVFSSVIFIFISGISWPWTAIPAPIKAIAYIIPSTPGIHGFIKMNTMGSTLVDVWPEYIALWIQALIYCITAILMYKWWIQNYDPEYKGMLSRK